MNIEKALIENILRDSLHFLIVCNDHNFILLGSFRLTESKNKLFINLFFNSFLTDFHLPVLFSTVN